MKKIHQFKEKIILLHCDNCGRCIMDLNKNWIEGAFQTGVNRQGEIGTWCSEKCLKEYDLTHNH